jgi:hypothetical protein
MPQREHANNDFCRARPRFVADRIFIRICFSARRVAATASNASNASTAAIAAIAATTASTVTFAN